MKKVGLFCFIAGIILICCSLLYKNIISNNSIIDIEKMINENYTFIDNDKNSWSYLEFTKIGEDYVVIIKKKSFKIENCSISESYNLLKFPIIIENNTLINKEQNFKIIYNINTFEFKGQDETTIFNGKYTFVNSLNNKYYNYPKLDNSVNSGVYTNDEKEYAKLFICYYNNPFEKDNRVTIEGYEVWGVVRDKGKSYVFSGEKFNKNNNSFTYELSMMISFNNNTLKMQEIEKTYDGNNNLDLKEKDGILNGKYNKISKISYTDMINDINQNISINEIGYGIIY